MASGAEDRDGGGHGRTPLADRVHPLHRLAGRLHEVLDGLTEDDAARAWGLTADEIAETVPELAAAVSRLTGLQLAAVTQAARVDVAASQGAVSTAAWLRAVTGSTGTEAHRTVRLALALEEPGHEPARLALLDGRLGVEQARVVVTAVGRLPDEVAPDLRRRACAHLVAEAAHLDVRALEILGNRLHEVVDPDGADAHLAALLERQEAEARRRTTLVMADDGEGTVRGRFTLPALQGTMLRRMLESIANPARPDGVERTASDSGTRRPGPEVMGEAFAALIDRIPAKALPSPGGGIVSVVVTMDLATLEERLERAGTVLDTGQQLSPGEVRRLAAEAGVIPAVLGGGSEVLDLGRSRRLHSKAQRLAMTLQQRGRCAVSDCDRPASWGDAHHLRPWSAGGATDLVNGALVCPRHHTLAHRPGHHLRRHPDGSLRYHRRE